MEDSTTDSVVTQEQPKGLSGGYRPPTEALTRIIRLHHSHQGWCYVCGGKWPCLTWAIADAGITGGSFPDGPV